MADLFDFQAENLLAKQAPLAARMRPQTLDDLVGQEHIVGKGRLLRRAIEADQLSSLLFYGPPGSGKTTLAQIISNYTKSEFVRISAVSAGISDVREVIEKAKERLKLYRKRTVVFIDEIHRFNKTQQDALLPAVEEGTIVLIGATTENPYFQVNRALISRSRIFKLEPLQPAHILLLLQRALTDEKNGLGKYKIQADADALQHLADMSGGDARNAYNGLELAALTTPPGPDGTIHIDLAVAAESIQQQVVAYDKGGDWHYDVASAFIKSMRGSDPDATLHWLARMYEAGEPPEFIARRIVICAAEDIGLANPQALVVAMAAAEAVHFVGWPEARIPLAMAAVYLAGSPKSNSAYMGVEAAIADLHHTPFTGVPLHLRDASYGGAKEFGHGKGYRYVHEYPGAYVEQQYLPDELQGKKYYQPLERGAETEIFAYLQSLKQKLKK